MSESGHQATFEAPDPEEVGLLFPAYDVHALIACGGMGAVYQATQRSLDRAVAIKILPREFSKDEAFRVGFEAEAKAMAKLNHPNLIGVYDFGEVGGMLFIVMEYVHGKSLFHSVNGYALEPSEALRIVIDVCHGLAHAHEHGVLHRDIKPGNILLDENANPKIGDFGLARALESEIQEGEQIFGTPGYTAPEVIEPPYTFDHRADIFSVGAMLYELLTGNTPDTAEASASHYRVSNPRINAIIQKATNPDPGSRFSSAGELARELEKIAASQSKSLATGSSSSSSTSPSSFSPNTPAVYPTTAPVKKSLSGGTFALLVLGLAALAIVFVVRSQKNKGAGSSGNGGEPVVNHVTITPDPKKDQGIPKDEEPPKDSGDNAGDFNPFDSPVVPVVPVDPVVPEDPAPEDPSKDLKNFDPFESPLVPVMPKEPVSDKPDPKEPELVQEPPAKPKYDVDAFFDRARGIMKEKVSPDIDSYKEEVAKNTDAFELKLRFIASDFYEFRRERAEQSLKREYEQWKKNGYLIPSRLPLPFRETSKARELHSAFRKAQAELKETLALKVRLQSETYITGIEYQIKRLEGTDDQPAIDLLKKEIERVKNDSDYFSSLMID